MKPISRRKTLKTLVVLGVTTLIPFQSFAKLYHASSEVCRTAWNNLSEFNRTRYQFRYINPKADLPNVFIYGDSISIAYTEYVRVSLEGKANVYRLHVNGGDSSSLIDKMETFRKAMFQPHLKNGWNFKWDVIHFNVGLHDLKYVTDGKLDKEKGKQVSSLKTYKKNLRTIIKYLKTAYPNTKLIFATTTPVPIGAEGRFAGASIAYNKAARKVIKRHKDIQINDLFVFTDTKLKGLNIRPDNVHFKPQGARLQGIEVAKEINRTLTITLNECPSVETIQNRFKEYENN